MGNSTSKPAPFLLINSEIPIEISDRLSKKLLGITPDSSSDVATTPHVTEPAPPKQDEHDAQLARKVVYEARSVQMVADQAEQVQRKLNIPALNIDPQVSKMQQEILACYSENKDKPLNCKQVVLEFKQHLFRRLNV